MGVLRPVVNRFQSVGSVESDIEPSKKIVTPATIMSASRPELARRARNRLVNGQKGAAYWAAAAFITDMEGSAARLTDKLFPKWHRGRTEFGELADIVADTAALLIISEGVLRGPKVHPLGKVAMLEILGQEGLKASWAGFRTAQFKKFTGEGLKIPVTPEGKEAMAEKMVGAGLAVATNELDNPTAKFAVGVASVAFATAGVKRGETVRRQYDKVYQILLDEGIIAKQQEAQVYEFPTNLSSTLPIAE